MFNPIWEFGVPKNVKIKPNTMFGEVKTIMQMKVVFVELLFILELYLMLLEELSLSVIMRITMNILDLIHMTLNLKLLFLMMKFNLKEEKFSIPTKWKIIVLMWNMDLKSFWNNKTKFDLDLDQKSCRKWLDTEENYLFWKN